MQNKQHLGPSKRELDEYCQLKRDIAKLTGSIREVMVKLEGPKELQEKDPIERAMLDVTLAKQQAVLGNLLSDKSLMLRSMYPDEDAKY